VTTKPLLRPPFEPLRREDVRLVTGAGRFVHDVNIEGMRHVAFVRSAVAHGRLVGLTLPATEGAVLLTARELGEHVMPPINELLPLEARQAFPLLGGEVISYVGQPLAMVVAHSRDAARRAAELVQVQAQERSATLDFAADAPAMTRVSYAQQTDDAAAQSVQAMSVRVQIRSPRVVAMSLEPRAAVAEWHDGEKALTLWLPTQTPSRARSDVAACLALHEAQVRVIAPDVGGAFGAKASVSPEDLLIALAAKYLRCALSWQASRSEEFASGMQGRGSQLSGELQLDGQGHLLGLTADLQFTLGAWLPFSGVIPLRNAARILPGPYHVAQLKVQGGAKRSHAAPINIYRGAGRPEAALLLETLMDKAAYALKIDPVDLRRRNLIASQQMPHATPTGELLDSGDYARALDLACQQLNYAQERQQQAQRRQRGEHVGIGVALYIEPCGQGWEAARVTLHPNGKITVASGSPAQGQGHETSFAHIAWQVLSPHLQCSLEDIEVIYGDTSLCPVGIGSLASRSMAIGGSAIVQACQELMAKKQALPEGRITAPLVAEAKYTARESWSYGCVIASMAIDAETGEPTIERIVWADDAGVIISPKLARGQLIGGLAQGLGQAMMEQIRYDDTGQLLTGSLMDYAVPRACDMPEQIDIVSMQSASPHNLLGAKGVGEAGCIGVPAALMNAVRDALQLPPEVDLDFPLHAEQLWRAMNNF
jgi:aerobic carbon-monoxide dehydrogenase large subunit